MKRLSIFWLFALFYSQSSAQLKEIFYDDFSSNQNKWALGEIQDLSIKIENGKYIIDSKLKNTVTPQLLAAVDSSKDFSISVNVRSITLNGPAEYGLIFGSNRYAYYCFAADTKGNYGLYYVTNNKIKEIIPISTTRNLKKGINTTNRLEVRGTGKKWNLFINDSLVNSITSRKFYGPFIGMSNEQQKAEYDDLKVEGTAVATSGNLCAMFPLIFQSAKNNFEYIKGEAFRKGDTSNYYSSIQLLETSLPSINLSGNRYFFVTSLKNNHTKAGIIKNTDSVAAQLKKCLPNFVFTKTLDKNGLPNYKITQKISPPGKQPEVTLYAYASDISSDFKTMLSIYADPVKNTEPPATIALPQKEKAPTSGWIVNDYFKNNENKWLIDSSSEAKYSMDLGYYMNTATDQSKIVLNTFRMPDNELHDYKIETSVQNFHEKDNSPFGLVFGNHAGHAFYFLITNNGTFAIKETTDTVVTVFKNFTYSAAIHASDRLSFYNTLSIIKIKNKWSFRINDREVYNCAAQHLGEKFGYLIPGKALLIAGSFKIYDWTVGDNFPNEPKELIYQNKFYDNFRSNKNGWDELNSSSTKSSFPNLDYTIEHKNDGYFMPAVEMSSSNLVDFRIELRASHKNGATDKGFGMCFGKKDIDNAFIFTIASDGTYEIGKFKDGEWTRIYKGDADVIYKNDYSTNTLVLEQTKGKWNFYVNHKLIHVFYSSILPGNKVGCFVEGKQEIGFDHLSYDEIEYREN